MASMLEPQITHDNFVDFLNKQNWEPEGSGMCFECGPEEISDFGRLAFETGLDPSIVDIPSGFAVLFLNKDLARLEEIGARFSRQGGPLYFIPALDYLVRHEVQLP